METKKEIKLPKLPYGQGSYSWKEDRDTIMYRKTLMEGDIKKIVSVYAESVKKCNDKMKVQENIFLRECQEKIQNTTMGGNTLGRGVYEWIKKYKYKQLKAKSYDTLEGTYTNQILKYPISKQQIESITEDDLQELLNSVSEDLSVSTTKKTYNLLKQYFDYVYAKKPYLNPMNAVSAPQKENKIKLDRNDIPVDPNEFPVLNDEEIKMFSAEASMTLREGVCGYKYGYGFLFIMWTFIRIGEALALQWKDVDIKNKTMYIYKTRSRVKIRDKSGIADGTWEWQLTIAKSKSGRRYVPICDDAITSLLMFKKTQTYTDDNDFIFVTENNKPICLEYLNRSLKNILSKADIQTKITIHGLRHTGISYFIRHGVSDDVVSKFAGHASKDITNDIYYTVIQKQKNDAISKINNEKEDIIDKKEKVKDRKVI